MPETFDPRRALDIMGMLDADSSPFPSKDILANYQALSDWLEAMGFPKTEDS